jgi:hypothetical protein
VDRLDPEKRQAKFARKFMGQKRNINGEDLPPSGIPTTQQQALDEQPNSDFDY